MSKGLQIALGALAIAALLGWYGYSQLAREDLSFQYFKTLDEFHQNAPEMLGRAAQYCREKYDGKRRVLMKVAGVAITVAFGIVVGILVIWTARSYFDAMFRGLEWMEQG